MEDMKQLKSYLEQAINDRVALDKPASLYDPIEYILQIGGKRLRPILTLFSAQMYGSSIDHAMDAALAVELFHNFTLVHDDIMDAADLRRGQPTIHHKWNVNTGILSGDAMLIMAYQLFNSYETVAFYDLHQVFSQTALQVCQGQQYDVDFETRVDVTVPEYLRMIKYKTAVLVGCALQMGAIVAQADRKQQQLIYDYGVDLGLAFQLMDDYLDAFGDPVTFGKEVGGDIRENKKTYLYLISYQNQEYQSQLDQWFAMDYRDMTPEQLTNKKQAVKQIYTQSGAAAATLKAIDDYTQKAIDAIDHLLIDDSCKSQLKQFSNQLMNRVQ